MAAGLFQFSVAYALLKPSPETLEVCLGFTNHLAVKEACCGCMHSDRAVSTVRTRGCVMQLQ